MALSFEFDFDVTKAALLYLAAKNLPNFDKYRAVKLLFLADREHLLRRQARQRATNRLLRADERRVVPPCGGLRADHLTPPVPTGPCRSSATAKVSVISLMAPRRMTIKRSNASISAGVSAST